MTAAHHKSLRAPPSAPKGERRSRPVALLVLLARSAPARVVPADPLAVGLDHGLLLRRCAVAALRLPLDRPLGRHVGTGGRRDGCLAERRGLLGPAAGVVPAAGLARRRELLLRLRGH